MRINLLLGLWLLTCSTFAQQIPYGYNASAGAFIQLNGVKHYYEKYGQGPAILLIHGNSTGIPGWAAQIDFFSKKYTVYAVDNRGRGRSELGNDSLSYFQQANDLSTFISKLKLDSVSIIGKSDGGIIALMMGIYFPQHIQRIVSFSANCVPDSTALYPETIKEIHNTRLKAEYNIQIGDTAQNWNLTRLKNRMMEFQPHLTAADLAKIQVPVLIITGDRDVIKEEHSVFIYRSIPKANLSILPGESHGVARLNPNLFNQTVDRFLTAPFRNHGYRFNY